MSAWGIIGAVVGSALVAAALMGKLSPGLIAAGIRAGIAGGVAGWKSSGKPGNTTSSGDTEPLWFTDFDKAVIAAKAADKDLLVHFTGSDWCGWCIKLHEEVFSTQVFQQAAPSKFILVSLDFPRGEELKARVPNPARNAELKVQYSIPGYPSILIMSPEGVVYARTGYQEGGPQAYLDHLDAITAQGKRKKAASSKQTTADELPADEHANDEDTDLSAASKQAKPSRKSKTSPRGGSRQSAGALPGGITKALQSLGYSRFDVMSPSLCVATGESLPKLLLQDTAAGIRVSILYAIKDQNGTTRNSDLLEAVNAANMEAMGIRVILQQSDNGQAIQFDVTHRPPIDDERAFKILVLTFFAEVREMRARPIWKFIRA